MRWQQSLPEVKVGDEWFKLVSLDRVPTPEIIASSQRTYGNSWQKRFEEDLVEFLSRMGHRLAIHRTTLIQLGDIANKRTTAVHPLNRRFLGLLGRRLSQDKMQFGSHEWQSQFDNLGKLQPIVEVVYDRV